MRCEERERNTPQVRAVLCCHDETWKWREACTDQERGGETEKHLTIQIQGFARRDTGRALVARAEETLIPIEEWLSEKHGEEGSQHKKGPKRDIVIALDDA